MMSMLEGIGKRSQPSALEDCFKRLVELFDNGVIHDEDGQWKLPMKDGKIDPISLSNTSARRIIETLIYCLILFLKDTRLNANVDTCSKIMLYRSFRMSLWP